MPAPARAPGAAAVCAVPRAGRHSVAGVAQRWWLAIGMWLDARGFEALRRAAAAALGAVLVAVETGRAACIVISGPVRRRLRLNQQPPEAMLATGVVCLMWKTVMRLTVPTESGVQAVHFKGIATGRCKNTPPHLPSPHGMRPGHAPGLFSKARRVFRQHLSSLKVEGIAGVG